MMPNQKKDSNLQILQVFSRISWDVSRCLVCGRCVSSETRKVIPEPKGKEVVSQTLCRDCRAKYIHKLEAERKAKRAKRLVKADRGIRLRRENPTPDPSPVRSLESPILTLRRRLGMTQEQFSTAIGCSQSEISKCERGAILIGDKLARGLRGISFDVDQVIAAQEKYISQILGGGANREITNSGNQDGIQNNTGTAW